MCLIQRTEFLRPFFIPKNPGFPRIDFFFLCLIQTVVCVQQQRGRGIMKRILFGLLFAGCVMHAHAVTLSDYCITSAAGCVWCSANASANAQQGGFCNGQYAGCSNGERVVGSGGTASDGRGTFTCTTSGFCYTSCNETRWYNDGSGTELFQRASGCKCDQWTTTSQSRCASGYYGDSTQYQGCKKCPEYIDGVGMSLQVYSTPGINLVIDDCFLEAGILSDTTGIFTLTGVCYYGDNPTGPSTPQPPAVTPTI